MISLKSEDVGPGRSDLGKDVGSQNHPCAGQLESLPALSV